MADNVEIELELTYLAKKIPEAINSAKPERLLDIYVPESADRPYIRLRQKGGRYEITKKKPVNDNDSSVQTEQTIPLEREEFEALSTASSRKVSKDRYRIETVSGPAEVDVFVSELSGLVLIDFEFDSPEDKEKFQPPDFCLAEVTQELFVAGGQLAGRTYKDIESELQRFNYKPLLV